MASERKFKRLTSKKESIFSIFQNMVDLSKDFGNVQKRDKFRILYSSLESTRSDLINVIDEINEVGFDIQDNFSPDYNILSTINDLYCHIKTAADKILKAPTATSSSSAPAAESSRLPSLPRIELPEFSGEIRQWETFYGIYKSLIHDNTSLNNTDKVHYLIGRLRGAALSVCAGIAPTGDNYDIIWKALLDKYQNERYLANSYLDQILNFKPLDTESEKNLNAFLETFDVAVSALKKLKLPDLTDFILLYLARSKLDNETVKGFDTFKRGPGIPTYNDLISFVNEQSKIFHFSKPVGANSTQSPRNKKFFSGQIRSDNKTKVGCAFCHKPGHGLMRCEKFKSLSAARRYELVKSSNWCYNCLSSGHGVRLCPSERTCAECSRNHHTLLHLGKPEPWENRKRPSTDKEEVISMVQPAHESSDQLSHVLCSTVLNTRNSNNKSVLLSTAVVNILNSQTVRGTARFILDSGSQVNLLTIRCCKNFGLNVSRTQASVQGLGQSSQRVQGETNILIGSRYNDHQFAINALLVQCITDKLPSDRLDSIHFPEWKNIPLADDQYLVPGEIDGIIGAELFPHLLGTNRIVSAAGSTVAMDTVFGYVVMGQILTSRSLEHRRSFFTRREEDSIEDLLLKFWELEQVPRKSVICPEDSECEKIFQEGYHRDAISGRFCVSLPFRYSPKCLGDSKRNAQVRLMSLEKRLTNCDKLRLEYNEAMRDFINQGHMRLVLDPDNSHELSYYIPHHAVLKPESSSTPVRIVLDASSPSESGVSLNDILYGGPKLQAEIFSLLLNFRLFKIAVTADIRQMYRQINVVKEHWPFQRLLWRFSPEDKIETYELTVVAFGIKSSPYLALRVVQQLIKETETKYPLAARYISRDLYMDDLVSSVPSDGEAHQLYQESVGLFATGAFELAKFSTNSKRLLDNVPLDKRLTTDVIFKADTKILGMQWNPDADILKFKLQTPDDTCTKRAILSVVARCYDPIGLIAPVLLHLKLLVRELWKLKLDWDARPPDRIRQAWEIVRSEWNDLHTFVLPRHLGVLENCPITILSFADACQDGYGAVVYCRTVGSNGRPIVRLVCAKSKVAPCKLTTIPRLELCAALLLSTLVKHVVGIYSDRVVITGVHAFSDSSTVLSWLQAVDVKDIFVANRVNQIKENVPDACWRHVDGSMNPADGLSRGLTPKKLVNHPLWPAGPDWIYLSEGEWPVTEIKGKQNILVVTDSKEHTDDEHPLLELGFRCSSWVKILRVTVWVLRFLKLLPLKRYMAVRDLTRAEAVLVKLLQLKYFGADVKLLAQDRRCSKILWKLKPFLSDGLLRVGGRLENSSLAFTQKHPLILPSKHMMVERIVDFYHVINLHPGPHLLEAVLRQKFWILGSRGLVRRRVHACNRCFRVRPSSLTPLMAPLPSSRVSSAKVFLQTGVDYFGPMSITLGRKRGAQVHKAYVCLFVCMSVKAIHLELVSSLSTQHFLQAFKRFLARRGPCKVIFSDQGTNFVGARSVLREINHLVNSDEYRNAIQAELAVEGVEWRFNTPYGPHQGGLWESNVKVVKTHIYRVVGDQLLTYEEFSTLLTQIEAVLNSRPLCQLSADASAPEALTPAHFLTLMPLRSLPADDLADVKMNRLDRFQLIDRMVQDFWKRWRLEYLTALQVRLKWRESSPNVTVGTVVILKTDNAPPLHWPLAVIAAVHPGKDGIIRNVTVKTSTGVFTRPVVKICPLPTQ